MKLNHTNRLLVAVAALGLSVISGASQAQEKWYLGGSVAQAFVDEAGIDDDDTGFKIFGGYRFNDYFSAEASYYDLVDVSAGGNRFAVDGGSLAAVGWVPLSDRFSLFGKVGAHAWDVDAGGAIAAGFTDNNGTDAFYGIGAEYELTPRWHIRGELERYEVDDFDVDVASVGVSVHF